MLLLLIDSWSGHFPQAVQKATPSNKNIHLLEIPKGTTGKIQPLHVFGFHI